MDGEDVRQWKNHDSMRPNLTAVMIIYKSLPKKPTLLARSAPAISLEKEEILCEMEKFIHYF
jgi:hypothetical protein